MHVEHMFDVWMLFFLTVDCFFVRGKQTVPPGNSLCVDLMDESNRLVVRLVISIVFYYLFRCLIALIFPL